MRPNRNTFIHVDGKGYSWVIEVELIIDWLESLEGDTYDQVIAALEILAEVGPSLGRPLVDRISGSRYKNLKELRPGSTGVSEIRILFAFDPTRRAIMLLAGDRNGRWQQWYDVNIPIAESLYDRHLANLTREQR